MLSVDEIGTTVALNGVGIPSAVQCVITTTASDPGVAALAEQRVVSSHAVQGITAESSPSGIVTIAAEQNVVPETAEKRIVSGSPATQHTDCDSRHRDTASGMETDMDVEARRLPEARMSAAVLGVSGVQGSLRDKVKGLRSANIAHQAAVLSLAEQPLRQVISQRQLIRSAFGPLPCGCQHADTVRSAR